MGWGHIDLFSEQSTGVQVCIRCVMHTDRHSCYLSLLLWVKQTCNQSILKHNSSNYCCTQSISFVTPPPSPTTSNSLPTHHLSTFHLSPQVLEKMCLHVFVCNKEVSVEHVAVREYSKECCNCPVRMCFLDVLFKKKKKGWWLLI